ncbi:hypothetical protein, partial [Nonomuraea indica]|uniref:hypothetical protein n=1 Tax=Nonomuraea indica TaxID=1581193 RepID=UPI001C5D6312
MAGFHYERSDPERFQQLCQALIVAEFPGVACYPVGQRDGGRDALQFADPQGGTKSRLFQVKFVREPGKIEDTHKWLEGVVAEEAAKVATLISRDYEVHEYILITNVPGTSYLDSGTMDRANSLLSAALPVPARMWWRDDLDRRCEANARISWAYPEILRGTDVLAMIADLFPVAFSHERYTALRKFIVEQHDEDSKVRFQQVELTNDLIKLFVDVPALIASRPAARKPISPLFHAAVNVAERVNASPPSATTSRRPNPYQAQDEIRVGAAALLLDETVSEIARNVVLEGGPGQGKSTLGQFVCQAHRLKILSHFHPERPGHRLVATSRT